MKENYLILIDLSGIGYFKEDEPIQTREQHEEQKHQMDYCNTDSWHNSFLYW